MHLNGVNVGNSEKNLDPRGGLPPPRGNIHVYYKNIQRSSLKPHGQSKPNFMSFERQILPKMGKWTVGR